MARAARASGRSRAAAGSRTGSSRPARGWLAAPGQRRVVAGLQARRGAAPAGTGVERAARRVVGELEGVEDRQDARVVAVGVVVGGALAEVAEPADEVGRVGPQELDHRLALAHRRDRAVGTPGCRPLRARQLRVASVESLSGPGGGRACCRSRNVGVALVHAAGAARGRTAAGPSRRAWTRRPAGRGRRASRAGRRTSSCPGAASSGSSAERLRERGVLGRDRARRRVRVADERRRARRAASASAVDHAATIGDEARRGRPRPASAADQPARRRQQRVEVLGRLAGLRALAAVLGREALDDVLEVARACARRAC